jgi:RNA polymerase sigma factor (TIGR02999 family)
MGEITKLLVSWRNGNEDAAEQLFPALYNELHKIAHGALRRRPGEHTLQTTALLNEAFVKLTDGTGPDCCDRSHFLALCAQVMRRVLVDSARARLAAKRGGGAWRVAFDENALPGALMPAEFLRLDDALTALSKLDPRKSKGIELRFFGGLSVEETAEALNISRETALRDWRFARAWLSAELKGA